LAHYEFKNNEEHQDAKAQRVKFNYPLRSSLLCGLCGAKFDYVSSYHLLAKRQLYECTEMHFVKANRFGVWRFIQHPEVFL